MEHKWGNNVQDYGLGNCGATLAARLLTEPQLVLLNLPLQFGFATVANYRLPNTELAINFGLRPAFSGVTSFPYGLLVEPDGPL